MSNLENFFPIIQQANFLCLRMNGDSEEAK